MMRIAKAIANWIGDTEMGNTVLIKKVSRRWNIRSMN